MSKQRITTCLFDLDGTLLQMDQRVFMKAYLTEFTSKCTQLGLDAEQALRAFHAGVDAMIGNAGEKTNEEAFWQVFSDVLGYHVDSRREAFIEFYSQEFRRVRSFVNPSVLSPLIVEAVREKGYRTVLATNPLFPQAGTHERISWAGLSPEMFDLITTYEDYSFTKPHLGYYRQILDRLDVEAEECLMIGNDVVEDMIVRSMGMHVFLVTDNLINRSGADISDFTRGTLSDLLDFCRALQPISQGDSL